MTVIVGSARIDENKHAKGGKAGDQTGKEVSTQTWYLHSKGWRVFRAKYSTRAENIAQDMQFACNNKHIGYDQSQRLTLYNIAEKVGFNCSKVTTNCETDCSALVRVCCAYAGIMLPNFTTSNEGKTLLNSGEFIELTDTKYTTKPDYLMRGDILVTKTQGHTVVVLNDGPKTEKPVINFDQVMIIGKSVFVRKQPDKLSLAVGIAYCGDCFPYRGETDGWFEIIYKDKIAYVTKKYTILTNSE